MFPLKKHQTVASATDAPVKQDVVISVESHDLVDYAVDLKQRYGVSVFHQQLGLETQQLDDSEREAMMDRIKETINDYDQHHPKTGSLHVYLLDGHGLGTASDAVVNGLIASSLRNPSRTLAALIPEDTKASKPDDLSPASMLKQLADHVLASQGVRVVVGRAALEAFLAGDESVAVGGVPVVESFKDEAAEGEPVVEDDQTVSKKLNPTTESVGDVLKETGIALAAVVGAVAIVGGFIAALSGISKAFSWLLGKAMGGKSISAGEKQKLAANLEHRIDEVIEATEKTYLNSAWMADAKMANGDISGQGISKWLNKNGHYLAKPAELSTAVRTHVRGVDEVSRYFASHIAPWATKVNQVADAIEAKSKQSGLDRKDWDSFLKTMEGRVESFGAPWEKIPFTPASFMALEEAEKIGVGKDYANILYWTQKDVPEKVPALSTEGVPVVADALILVLKAIRSNGANFMKVPAVADGEDTHHFDAKLFGEEDHEAWDDVNDYDALSGAFWHNTRHDRYEFLEWGCMESLVGIAEALVHLLQRSVLKK